MAFSTATSRFSLLTDDASDPFVKKPKTKPTNPVKATKPGSGSTSSQQKKAKDKKNQAATGSSNATKPKLPIQKVTQTAGNASRVEDMLAKPPTMKKPNDKQNPKQKSDVLDWESWEKRDTEFVTTTFNSELEEALLQSKLDYQKQLQTTTDDGVASKQSKSKKKKKVPVSITQFHEMVSSDSNANQAASVSPERHNEFDEESLISRLRTETQLELLKEKQHAEEKAILLSRNAHFINGNGNVTDTQANSTTHDGDDDDGNLKLTISKLKEEKLVLVGELDLFKNRYKKLLGLLSDTELKEKVHLLRDLQKMAESNQDLVKLNQDLNDELKNVYSQLEQERSRSNAAMMEVKKMNELSRRGRTHSQMELSQ